MRPGWRIGSSVSRPDIGYKSSTLSLAAVLIRSSLPSVASSGVQ